MCCPSEHHNQFQFDQFTSQWASGNWPVVVIGRPQLDGLWVKTTHLSVTTIIYCV